MMPALLRLQNGDALFCYTERNLELTWGKRWCQRSTDGGMTWSKPTLAMADLPLQRDGLTLNMPTGPHDRLIQTSSGRVLFPVHFPWLPGKSHTAHSAPRIISSTVYYSDDQGHHWQRACEPMLIRGMTPAATKRRDLHRDPRETRFGLYYCYPTVLFDEDRLHMTYYGPASGQQFNLIYQQLPAVWFVESGDGSR
jgi:hypothetical protein